MSKTPKAVAKRDKASRIDVRLVAFGQAVGRGMSAPDAARAAGYGDGYVRGHVAEIEARAREAGLIPKPEDVRDAVAESVEILRDELPNIARALVREAKAGNVPAIREAWERAAGKSSGDEDARRAVTVTINLGDRAIARPG